MENNNIQKGHTYEEYRKRFGRKFDKGKLLGFHENEISHLNSKRQYWEIKDKNAKYRYYELPKYIKVKHVKSAYSLNRKINRHAFVKGTVICCLTAVLIGTSFVITRNILTYNKEPDTPVIPPDVPLEELELQIKEFGDWKKDHPNDDATKTFNVNKLANFAMANTFFEYKVDKKPDEHYVKKKTVSVGYGNTISDAPLVGKVNCDISNAFILDGDKSMDESISHGEIWMVPSKGKRDYFNDSEDKMTCYGGEATSSKEVKWEDKIINEFNKESYQEKAGKDPMSPFFYIISEDTILSDSSAIKTENGYEITMKLDPSLSTAKYKKRMEYISDKKIKCFNNVELIFRADENMILLESEVTEDYIVLQNMVFDILEVPTAGKLKTRYFHDDIPQIPSISEGFDYSKYDF